MRAAATPRDDRTDARLLHLNPCEGEMHDARLTDLSSLLRPGDLLVVNDAATLPASLRGTIGGVPIELRFVSHTRAGRFVALLFGDGDHRTRTEDREPPPLVRRGDSIAFEELGAIVQWIHPRSNRLVEIAFDREGDRLVRALYALGRPIQYAHVPEPLALYHVQNVYAGRPWALELPSAGYGLSWSLLDALRSRGVEIARVTHAAGISSTGDRALDALLPWPERSEVPIETAQAIARTRERGGRVVAAGTSVVRALEAAADPFGTSVTPGERVTELRIDEHTELRVVDGLLTGMHVPGESHYDLLSAFADRAMLEAAHEHASEAGYRAHEFGDATLVLCA
jgi:S-adenosylmethionine:tRNA ribosyltransferase-isomerase